MRSRGGWWAIVCALGGLIGAGDARATAPTFPGVITTTLTSADEDLPIPDNASLVTVLTSELPGVVVDVDLTLDITHPTADQLDVYLVGPSGRTVTITTDNGQQNDDVFAGTTFDDQATGAPSAPNVRNFTYTNGVATGPIQPEGAMSALVGETDAGPWALVVIDDSGGSTGMLHGWSLTISTLSSLPRLQRHRRRDPDNNATGATHGHVAASARASSRSRRRCRSPTRTPRSSTCFSPRPPARASTSRPTSATTSRISSRT
jgi:subtilisin-like proprotein convertase family protein